MDDSNLDPIALGHLAAYRAEVRPGAERATSNWRAVVAQLPVAAPDIDGDAWGDAIVEAGPTIGLHSLKVFALTVAIGTAGLVGIDLAAGGRPDSGAPYVEPSSESPREGSPTSPTGAEPPAAKAHETIAARPDSATEVEPSARAITRAPATDEPSKRDGRVGAELELMRSIRTAVDDGRHEEALRLLDRHARQFGDGVFRPEREGLHALVLCASGRSSPGRRAAAAFLAEHPGSPLVVRVERACDRSPDAKDVTDRGRAGE